MWGHINYGVLGKTGIWSVFLPLFEVLWSVREYHRHESMLLHDLEIGLKVVVLVVAKIYKLVFRFVGPFELYFTSVPDPV